MENKKEIKANELEDNELINALFKKGEYYRMNKKNFEYALKWYKAAAELGHDDAMNNVGVYYHNGIIVKKDIDEALKWYIKAADKGNKLASANAARILVCYKTSKKNAYKAFDILTKNSDGKDPEILYELGRLFYSGLLGYTDYSIAYRYLKLAKKNGRKDNYYLGQIYLHGLDKEHLDVLEGIKILDELANKKDYDSAIDLFKYYYERNELDKAEKYKNICKKLGFDALQIINDYKSGKIPSIYGLDKED